MAQRAERRTENAILSPHNANGGGGIDLAVKGLIDDLIVPYLVEEFLRLHGPAAVAKLNARNLESQPDSELNSTP
jgi:hypothetical protein